jgi:hypothetical protein
MAHANSFLEASITARLQSRFVYVLRSLLRVCLDVPRPYFSIANKSATVDKASRVLAQPVLTSLSRLYRARADHSRVPYTTLHYRAQPSLD